MRYFLFLISLLLLLGCIGQTPLALKGMEVKQTNDEVMISVPFSGNAIPDQMQAHLQLLTSGGSPIYDHDFTLKKEDFKTDQQKLIKYMKLESSAQFSYAEFIIDLPNGTASFEQGQRPDILKVTAEVIEHETQYAVNMHLMENNKPANASGPLTIKINDAEGTIYSETRYLNRSDFNDGYTGILLPYNKIRKSFYSNGTLMLEFQKKQITLKVKLKQYTEDEKKRIEEKQFADASKAINAYTEYVGFSFNVTRTGYYYAHLPDRKLLVRFDARLKNALLRPQYLVRDDFYMKDADRNFYPVYVVPSTDFTPLLMQQQEINASFYFNIIAEKTSYSFYYGDKKLADFNVSAKK